VASPVKPEPGAKTPPEGSDGPKLNPLEAALASAREAQQSGKGILSVKEEEKKPPDEADDNDDAGEEEEDGGDGTEDDEGDEEEGEGEGQDEEESDEDEGDDGTGEGEEGDEDESGEGEAEEDDEEVDPDLIVELPPRREGDPDVELVVENKDVAERIRQLKNGYMAGTQVREAQEAIDRDRAQIDEIEVWIGTDPTGFIIQNTPAEVIEDVALSLVFHPDVFERVAEKIRPALDDPQERRVLAAELKAARADAQTQLRRVVETRRFAKEQAKIVRDSIAAMVPETEGISDNRRQAIIQTLETAAAQTIRSKKIEKIEPDDVPVMLAAQLRAAGIDPLAAAQALKDGGSTSKPGKSPAKKKKQPTRKELKAAAQKRKRAAASTPPGGGAPAARTKLPKGQTLEERFKLAREKGLGALLGR